jgi:hypothetical protein
VSGTFSGATTSFGANVLTNANNSGFSQDLFVAKLTDAGATSSFNWAQRAGGTGAENAVDVAVNGTSIYITGSFLSSTAPFGNTNLVSSGSADVYVAKLIDAGTSASFVWAQQAGGTGADICTGLAISGTSMYIGGYFGSASMNFGTTRLTNAGTNGSSDIFLAKLTDTGATPSFSWAQQAGGLRGDAAFAVAVTGTSVYAGGVAGAPATFGSQQLTHPGNANTSLAFLASVTDVAVLKTPASAALSSVEVYPNPALNTAMVKVPAMPGTGQSTLRLSDAMGRVVLTRQVTLPAAGRTFTLDLSGLIYGIYTLQIQVGTEVTTRRLAIN